MDSIDKAMGEREKWINRQCTDVRTVLEEEDREMKEKFTELMNTWPTQLDALKVIRIYELWTLAELGIFYANL